MGGLGYELRLRPLNTTVAGGLGVCQSNYACPGRAAPGFHGVTSGPGADPFTAGRNAAGAVGRRSITPRPTGAAVGRGAATGFRPRVNTFVSRWSLPKGRTDE